MDIQDINLRELIESEIGERFNKQGYIKCPFHSEKTASLSVKFNSNKNKDFFKCFGCDTCGDAIDFISKYKGMDYIQAREYLGFPVEKTELEKDKEKIINYIEWQISKVDLFKDHKLISVFEFTNEKNEVIYYKAKLLKPDGKKRASYYHFDGDKIVNNRKYEEIPYNLHNVLQGISKEDIIIVVEGEKDANTLNRILRNNGYVSTSIKGCKDLSILKNSYSHLRLYVIGDTGEAGEIYKWQVHNELFNYSSEFKFINLPGLKNLGDNKDVTDWLEQGHDKKDLINAFKRSLNLKSKFELQQDSFGIYRTVIKEKDGYTEESKVYITNFNIEDSKKVKYIDDEESVDIELNFKNKRGKRTTRIGPSDTFKDTSKFNKFFKTTDLTFKGTKKDIPMLEEWIDDYFLLEEYEKYKNTWFTEYNNEISLVTSEGIITAKNINNNVVCDESCLKEIIKLEDLTKKELEETYSNIFNFIPKEKATQIIGTIINNLAVYHCEQLGVKLHHLFIYGLAGSGKSETIENVVVPILNYKDEIKTLDTTKYSLINTLSQGNYTAIFDEFKPSMMKDTTLKSISSVLRILYDRSEEQRGNKDQTIKKYKLSRPIVFAGEEGYPNSEKALVDRSCIVNISKKERTEKSCKSWDWIKNNHKTLNKLGNALIKTVLSLTINDYKQIRLKYSNHKTIKTMNDRFMNTAINISCGMDIFNILLSKYGIKPIKEDKYVQVIVDGIKDGTLNGEENSMTVIEQMLVKFDEMMVDNKVFDIDDVLNNRIDVAIRTGMMIDLLNEHYSRYGGDFKPLTLADFRKQAKSAGYITSNKNVRFKNGVKKADIYNIEMLKKINLEKIIPQLYMIETDPGALKQIPF